ncbi:LPS export ABC transporter permease LptF [Pseudaestuariivita atlantica]|uniref:Permease n=1 Tax=Pseudaestuariivita atlantica TaxID=1317121 RepID=A0A0L1JKV5_9RHOB|nr:LPS export ABC transporter permease LptF [Pseudaestuariivita atlantica]KNG92357.1 permease [Pseudaestuariivita atlantica]
MLSQLLALFGFFSLVLVSVYWVNRAVVLFDQLIADGQPLRVFAEFTALSLPPVIAQILPMSTFAAAVYVTNRLSSESELTVMQATGYSPWRLARPVLTFGLIVTVMMGALTHLLVPSALEELKKREKEISASVSARLLREGTFLHPADGVTFYIGEITPEGELRDVFLSDRRVPERSVAYTAEQAYLFVDDAGPKLVMVNGLAQVLQSESGRLSTTNFTDFSYDISGLVTRAGIGRPKLRHASTWDMLTDPATVAAETKSRPGQVAEELHMRFQQPLLCAVAALIGFSTLLIGGFSRFGVWRQILLAIFFLVLVKLVESLVTDPVRHDARLWPLVYAPSVVGLGIVWAMLFRAAHPVFRAPPPRMSEAAP